MKPRLLTPQMLYWLRACLPGSLLDDTVRLFNEAFGVNYTKRQLQEANSYYKFGRPARPTKRKPRIFTVEQFEWLKWNYDGRPVAETTRLINERFGAAFTRRQIREANKYHKFGRAAVPTGGHPGTQGTQFQNGGRGGQVRGRDRAMLEERVNSQGILEIKVPVAHTSPSIRGRGWGQNSSWMRKARWVWQYYHGEIPEGHCIVQLDGDTMNCDLDNLVCVPRRVIQALNHKYNLGFHSRADNPTRVRLAQLKSEIIEALKAVKREHGCSLPPSGK